MCACVCGLQGATKDCQGVVSALEVSDAVQPRAVLQLLSTVFVAHRSWSELWGSVVSVMVYHKLHASVCNGNTLHATVCML